MDKTGKLGWIVAAVAVLAAALLYAQVRQLKAERAELQAALDEQATRLAHLSQLGQRSEEMQTEAERVKQDLAEAQERLAGLEAATEAQKAAADEKPAEPGAEEAAAGPEADNQTEGQPDNRERRVVRAQMGMMVDMSYRDFFEDLQLPPEMREAVHELLTQAATDKQLARIAGMRKEGTVAREVKLQEDAADVQLRDGLRQVLSPQEMRTWEEYAAYEDQLLFERLIEGQLTMLASGLTPENRDITKAVMAEELVAHLDAYANSDQPYTLANHFAAQSAALQSSLLRLADSFDADQYGHIESFVAQAEAMFRAVDQQQP